MYTMTPLHIAVDKNDFETVNFFMARLENKMPKSESGMTPLHICAKVGIKLQTTTSIYTSYSREPITVAPLKLGPCTFNTRDFGSEKNNLLLHFLKLSNFVFM